MLTTTPRETICAATIDQIPLVLPLIQAFAHHADPHEPFCERDAMDSWELLLSTNRGVLLVGWQASRPIGMIGLSVRKNLYNDRWTAAELVWWVEPEARQSSMGIRLLDAAESWARDHRVASVMFGRFCDADGQRLDAVYQRRGFTPYGIGWRKKLLYV